MTAKVSADIISAALQDGGLSATVSKSGEIVASSPGDPTTKFYITKEEISDLVVGTEADPILAIPGDPQTCIATLNSREQLISVPTGARLRPRLSYDYTFSDPSTRYTVKIGRSSAAFRYNALKSPAACERLIRRASLYGGARMTLSSLEGYTTARFEAAPTSGSNFSQPECDSILRSCLFDLSYHTGLAYDYADEWVETSASSRSHILRPRSKATTFNTIPKDINADLFRFYARGRSSNDAFISFISFYHVVEYFFLSSSDSSLYRKLRSTVHAPDFDVTDKSLDKIIAKVSAHRSQTDEKEMLRLVLEDFVDESDLLNAIESIEKTFGSSIYSKKSHAFGYELDAIPREKFVAGAVAKRLKIIRNALVHSSDRYERAERYVPGAQADTVINRELPLLQFLAEQVIIASAKPLT